eukprot:gene13543-biopygen77
MTMCLMLFAFIISVLPDRSHGAVRRPQREPEPRHGDHHALLQCRGFSGFVVMFLFLQPWTAKDEKEIRDKMKVAKRTEPISASEESHVLECHPCTSPAPLCVAGTTLAALRRKMESDTNRNGSTLSEAWPFGRWSAAGVPPDRRDN